MGLLMIFSSMNDRSNSVIARQADLPVGGRHVFVAWTDFQRRQLSMQKTFGFTTKFMGLPSTNLVAKFSCYVRYALATLAILVVNRPRIVWVQLPPMPLLMVVLAYKSIFNHGLVVVADCHNGVFRPPWSTWPGFRKLLGSCDLILVHNQTVAREADLLGVKFRKLCVLEDCPATITEDGMRKPHFKHPLVLFPAGFAKDEPIKEVMEAARRMPDVTFVLTGRLDRARANHDLSGIPDNLKLTGFLPAGEFNAILMEADIVLALTTVEGIQLSACNEAIGAGKPMVLSDTFLLRELFGAAAVFVRNEAGAIAGGLSLALQQSQALAEQVRTLRCHRTEEWLNNQAAPVRRYLEALVLAGAHK